MKAYYLFGKSHLPEELSNEIRQALLQISNIDGKEEYLKAAYDIITTRYHGGRVKTILRPFDLFTNNVQSLWNRTGFLHCTNQNYLLTLLLVKGGKFKEKDIKPTWTLMWSFSPHQYLKVDVGNKIINVDPWSNRYGVPFGQHAHGFNTSVTKKGRI